MGGRTEERVFNLADGFYGYQLRIFKYQLRVAQIRSWGRRKGTGINGHRYISTAHRRPSQ